MNTITAGTIESIKEMLIECGEIAVKGRDTADIHLKSDRTPFTDVELSIEKKVFAFIDKFFPGDQIISEEKGVVGEPTERIWVLDPIDGTRAYINGLPTWGILLGLLEQGEPTLGFFYMAKCNDFFWGARDSGAFLNDHPMPKNVVASLEDPLAFLAVPTNFHLHYQTTYPRIRSVGSTAANLCYTALGSAIGTITRKVSLWDVAGILPILEQAGIAVEFMNGDCLIPANHADGQKLPGDLIIAAPENMDQIRKTIQPL